MTARTSCACLRPWRSCTSALRTSQQSLGFSLPSCTWATFTSRHMRWHSRRSALRFFCHHSPSSVTTVPYVCLILYLSSVSREQYMTFVRKKTVWLWEIRSLKPQQTSMFFLLFPDTMHCRQRARRWRRWWVHKRSEWWPSCCRSHQRVCRKPSPIKSQ